MFYGSRAKNPAFLAEFARLVHPGASFEIYRREPDMPAYTQVLANKDQDTSMHMARSNTGLRHSSGMAARQRCGTMPRHGLELSCKFFIIMGKRQEATRPETGRGNVYALTQVAAELAPSEREHANAG